MSNNNCGKVVHSLFQTVRTNCVQFCGVLRAVAMSSTHTGITPDSYTGLPNTTHRLTHTLYSIFQSVIYQLYTLSTETTNTRTKGYIK